MARHDYYEPGAREPVSGIARKLWDKAIQEAGAPPLRLIVGRPGRVQQAQGACSHSMEVIIDGERREYLAWWPNAEALAVPLRGAYFDYHTSTYWIG